MLLDTLSVVLSAASIAYLVLAIQRVHRFRERRRAQTAALPAASVLLPVHGAPHGLYECLRSCCEQDYPEYQVVFGLHAKDDPALAVIERLRRELPRVDMAVVIDGRRIGANPKVCNLANMRSAAKHDLLVMVDSDVYVDRGFLEMVAEPFADAGVGGVTCLYRGRPRADLASRLGALHIDHWFIPSAIVDLSMRPIDIFYGAVMAVRRQALDAIGGFEALASAVAEDDVLGALCRRAGFKLVLSPYVVETVVAEEGLLGLLRHELRWMRSVRACRPVDHALSVVMYALLPCALLFAARPSVKGAALLAAMLGLRLALSALVRRRLGSSPFPWWLLPLRDGLSFCVWAASYGSWSMRWGSQELVAGPGRTMAAEV